jgi:hypothetical protein
VADMALHDLTARRAALGPCAEAGGVVARRCRPIEEMETVTAIERFRAIAGERSMVLGELLDSTP